MLTVDGKGLVIETEHLSAYKYINLSCTTCPCTWNTDIAFHCGAVADKEAEDVGNAILVFAKVDHRFRMLDRAPADGRI